MVYSVVLADAARMVLGSSPKPPPMPVDMSADTLIKKGPAAMLISTVSRSRTRGESEESIVHRRGSMQVRESTLALKPRADVTRSPK